MVQLLTLEIIVFIAFADIATTLIKELENKTLSNVNNHVTKLDTRRKSKTNNHRSTSSSSGDKSKSSSEGSGQSLGISSSKEPSSSSAEVKKTGHPKSSAERRGWRKWHRVCPKCPDMTKKWRDPSIEWICGAYQRARRSFKSECMMQYRNCQDGTMFVRIYRGRCQSDTQDNAQQHGDHFFYEYKVRMSDSTSDTSQSTSSHSSKSDDTD